MIALDRTRLMAGSFLFVPGAAGLRAVLSGIVSKIKRLSRGGSVQIRPMRESSLHGAIDADKAPASPICDPNLPCYLAIASNLLI